MPADSMLSLGAGDTNIESVLSGLVADKTYYVWAYATNTNGTRFSPSPTIITTPTVPTVITTAARSVLRYTAVSGGDVTDDGGATVSKKGVCYSKWGLPTTDSLNVAYSSGRTGSYSMTLKDLEERTTYYVRAYAINSLGTGYGQVDTLTTLAVPVVVTTTPPDSVWSTGIISGGEVLSDGGRSVIRRGVCWSSTALPDVSLSTRTVR
jgi:hypothetical protein